MSQGIPFPASRFHLEQLLKCNTSSDTNNVRFRIKLPDENRYVELYVDGITWAKPEELTINMKVVPT